MGSSQGCWWFGPEGSNRVKMIKDWIFFVSRGGTAVLPGGFCEGFEVKRGYIRRFQPQQLEEGDFIK